MKKWLFLVLIVGLSACSGESEPVVKSEVKLDTEAEQKRLDNIRNTDHIYAVISTTKGDIVCDLAYEHAPMTVGNFVALAEGQMETPYNPGHRPYYDELVFHRVLKEFMIQGGDPMGSGSGGPGYSFKDEFTSLKHDRPGTLSMANSGPNTNGSQFFITHVPTPWLDGDHTVFGYVVHGQEVVDLIEANDVILHIEIQREGGSAKDFDAMQAIDPYIH